jgi:spermidine synthase
MKKTGPVLPLFAVIVLEGYAVLASELIAIRQTIPFIGSGTDTISIIIAAVLMPLAFGYYAGGRFRAGDKILGRPFTIRGKLVFNLITALCFLIVALSFSTLKIFFGVLIKDLDLTHRHILAAIYSLVLLVVPVYLLGQTIPLVSNYFGKERLAQITGRILFFSTMGSFLGSLVSTLVLMSTIGVNYTAVVVFIILALLVILLAPKKISPAVAIVVLLAGVSIGINTDASMRSMNIIKSNTYNTIAVMTKNGARHLFLNGDPSSKYSDAGDKYDYVKLAEKIAIGPIRNGPPKEILVIGAGGFTFGFEDRLNNYDFVDIDKDLKEISEEYLLRQPLPENKHFFPVTARGYLMQTEKKYDVILLDVYLGKLTIPEHLLTREFFQQVKDHLNDNGIVIGNFVTSPNFASKFSRNLDNTFRSVFPYISRHIVHDSYNPWNEDAGKVENALYIYRHHPDEEDGHIYTDDKNSAFLDRP